MSAGGRWQPSARSLHGLPSSLTTLLSRWDGALLDPRTADPRHRPQSFTAYRPGGLLLHDSGGAGAAAQAALSQIFRVRDWIGDWVGTDQRRGVQLRPADATAHGVDSWAVLGELRATAKPEVAAAVGLDHLMSTAEQVGGNPFAIGHGRIGLDGYGAGGYAGRGPVQFLGPPPPPVRPGRRPRVVVLDTGLGDHPWFRDDRAHTTMTMADGTVVGPRVDPSAVGAAPVDGSGAIPNPLLGSLASHTGHGTFIAGLIRQSCPQADLVALAVMGADGIVPESTLTDALALIAARQRQEPGWADAVVLSLGYYAETGDDVAYSTRLAKILVELSEGGVAVFCAAGNDASSRPSYPAAFALDPRFARPDVLPLVSVAALNPDGSVALFSNDGPWVVAEAPGVNLVSTAPISTDGSSRPAVRVAGAGRRPRAAIDGDDFSSGFASWSGTSFAAPVLAGRYLRALVEAGFPSNQQRRALVPLGRRSGPVRSM